MKTKLQITNLTKTLKSIGSLILLVPAVLFMLSISASTVYSQTALVTSPSGGFQIDGDLKSNTPSAGVGDWVQGSAGSGGHVFNNDGTPIDQLNTKLVIDPYDVSTDQIFQGSKFNQDPGSWSWTYGKPSGKNDIRNVMYHVGMDASNDFWVILGSDRYSTSGTSYIDFEFLQNTVTRNDAYGFDSEGLDGGRTVNDLIISMEYNNGGSTGNVSFYLWKPVGAGFDYVLQTVAPGVAFAATNTLATDVPFGAFGTTTYSPYQFVEAAVNISDLFGAIDPCFGINVHTIIVKTKASTSITANLGDFVEPIQVSLSFGTANVSYLDGDILCPLGNVSVNLTGVTGGSFSSSPAGLSVDALTGEIDLDNSSPGTYTVTYSFVSNSCPRTATTQVTVLEPATPPLTAVSDLDILCSDYSGDITLSYTGGSGVTLNWYSGSCNGTLVGTGNNLVIPAPTTTTTYYAAWENPCGISSCEEVTVTVLSEVIVNPSITATISSFNASDGELTVSVSGGTGTYTYSLNGGLPQGSNVFSGLSSGNYTIEVIDSNGCIANANISIANALEIIAVDDSGSIEGMSGGTAVTNVLVNDSLNSSVVDPADVDLSFISSTDPAVTLVGSDVIVAPGTVAGTYYLVYQICEIANPTNCDQATVTVIVIAAEIIANDDNVGSINGYDGAVNVLNVFDNDLLNGDPVNPVDVVLTETVPDPFGYITLNPDGSVDVAAGTPAGNYDLTYQICEVLNPTNCDDAVVTVTIAPPTILAVDDSATGIEGTAGAVNVLNVFDNDLLNGDPVIPAEVVLTLVTPNIYLTLNPDGSVDVLPFTPGGNYTLTYQICEVLNPTNCDQAIVTIEVVKSSDVSIVKSHIDPSNLPVGSTAGLITIAPSVITAGTKIYYFLQVDNFGPDRSVNALITDMLPAGITNPEFSLNFGNSWFPWVGTRMLTDFDFPGENHILIRGDVDPDATGTLTNTATIFSSDTFDPDLTNNTSTVVTTIEQSADLNLTKQAIGASVVIGGQIVYQITITNYGPSAATNVIITDVIDPAVISGVEYSIDGGGSWLSPWTGSLNVGTLADGASSSIRIRGTIIDVSPAPNVDPIPNTASVTSDVDDPDLTNNEQTIYTRLIEEADLSIIKTGPASVVAGESIQYTIDVTNNSNTFDALDVHVHDVINLAIIADVEYSIDGGTSWLPWMNEYVIGTMTPLSTFQLFIRGTVLSSVIADIPNTAVVEADTPDPDITNNTSTIITPVDIVADLEIIKIQVDPAIVPIDSTQLFSDPYALMIDPLEITAGDSIYYILVYTNYGPSDVTNSEITDLLPAGISNFDASRCQANYFEWTDPGNQGTIVAGGRCLIIFRGVVELDASGNLINTATITNTDGIFDPDLTNNTSTVITPIIARADLSILKTVDNSTPYVGDDVTFTITVTNLGPNAATNADVTDLLPNGYTYVSHTVSSGSYDDVTGLWTIGTVTFPGSEVLTITATVNLPVVGVDYLNIAIVTGLDQFDPEPGNDEDDEITDPINVIIANDDNGGPINGYDGAINILNVFDNDLLNGFLVIPADLILTETVADPTGNLSLNLDGSVDVAPGTPEGTYTLTYQICEIIDPINCDDALVTITVSAPVIIANDDNAGGINGYDGAASVLNVFDNDLLNGDPVIPAEVNLTETVPDPNGYLTLNPDGTVDVAAGTPEGTYNLTYQICEVINPTNCDDAIVTIIVVTTPIIANDDNATGINGYDGATSVLNVFDNDLLNGDPVIPAEVNLTETVPDPNGYLTLNPDGTVDVAPGTPEGTYTLTYQICEVLNPTNCDDAIVTITVSSTSILAVDDLYESVNGYVGATNVLNVFDNDLLNGNPVNSLEVVLTETIAEPSGYLILNPDGSVDVLAGTPAGTYYLTYQICEVLNPTNCDDALVTVRVEPPQILAVDDYATGINGFAGATDVLNVFDNDLLNGDPVDPSEVTLEETVPEPNGYLTLNPDGSVDVAPGTPAGTYSLIYEICEILNPTNCSDATVYVTISAAMIAANDDNFNSNPIDCETGGVAGNVLGNDLLDGIAVDAADVNITLTDDGGIVGISIAANGDLNIPAGVAVGTYLLEYQICEVINPLNCDIANIQITVYDTEDPTITCPTDVAVNSDPMSCEATGVVIVTPTVNDNCGVMSVVGVRSDLLALTDPYPLGTTTITWTVTDYSGNFATCDQLVVVTDVELPTIVCPTDVAVNTDPDECSASGVVLGTPTTDDNCTVVSVTNDAPAIFPIGITTVTWTVTDGSGNIETCEQLVTVTDIEFPTIVCPTDVAVNTDADECTASGVILGTPTTDDNCTVVSVTNDAPATFPIGTTIVTWTVTDGSGNIETCEQLVIVTDIEFPTIVCPTDVAVNTDADECTASGVVLGTPTTDDNCTVASVTNDAPATFPIGTTTVTWTVTDGSGNIETCEQLVTVTDIELPTIDCPVDVAVNTDADECTASGVVLGTPTTDDNCTVASITNDAPAIFPIGTTTVTWTVTDGSGNIETCEQLVTVTDNQMPEITCPDDIVSCSNVIDLGTPVVSDNCGIANISNDAPVVFPIGETTTVTWTVTDVNGNNSYCEQLVSVSYLEIDVTSSQVTCSDDSDGEITVTVIGGTGEYSYSVNSGVSQMSNVFENMTAGEYSIMVTDENGCYQIVETSIGSPEAVNLTYNPYCETGIVGIALDATGGTQPFTYSIDGGSTYQESNSFENLTNGTSLFIVAIDANDCLSPVIEVPVEGLNTLEATANIINNNNCYGMNDAVVEMDVSGGDAPYIFTVNGDQVYYDNIINNLAAGDNVITIRDSNGCPAETEVNIIASEPIEFELIYKTNADCNGNNDGTAEIEVVGGFAPYDYIWDDGSNQNLVTGLNAGTHIVTVTDLKGCEVTYEIIIDSDQIYDVPEVNNTFTPNNDGQNDNFTIDNIELFPENELVILNRWGNEVYTRASYDNSWNGSNLSEGTYFYILNVKMCDEVRTINGYITILR
jgi:uncharacterized repeat protein (TIGR01451 family)/gliding motility-associated-like protein